MYKVWSKYCKIQQSYNDFRGLGRGNPQIFKILNSIWTANKHEQIKFFLVGGHFLAQRDVRAKRAHASITKILQRHCITRFHPSLPLQTRLSAYKPQKTFNTKFYIEILVNLLLHLICITIFY